MGLQKKNKINRRDFLASVASVPLVGTTGINRTRSENFSKDSPIKSDDPLRLGIVGFGNRGEELVSAIKEADLNIEFRGVSEVYTLHMNRGLEAAGSEATGYKNYIDLLERDDINAVIIATPDHWHARMAIDAANRGKHIYLEKCMTRTLDEAKELRDAVKKSNVVFQLGHQGRQRDLNHRSRKLIDNGTLGKISLIETTTNRNDSPKGWEAAGEKMASTDAIDWKLFQGPDGSNEPFNAERYFGWRNYWEYGTGMSGDLLTTEFDTMNAIMDLGIPETAVATGGLYLHLDGREVPDVFQAAFEYPKQALTLLYSGTLASGIPRGNLIMGQDATLELGRNLYVWVDKLSAKYKSRIEAGIIDPSTPLVNYQKESSNVDAVSSATTKYMADRGLATTYRDGREVSTTQLHMTEWINCIRRGSKTSCNIDRGFEEAIVAHMATHSYLNGRKVRWDADTETII